MAKERLYFMDNLRAALIFLVVFLHVAVCYMMYAPSWWYVVNPKTSLLFTKLVILIDIPVMPIMFFIAGYFAIPSLQRHGATQFIYSKLWRVFLPWVLGILFLAPPTAYLTYYTRKAPVDLVSFWSGQFWTESFQHSVYWFLIMLFWFFCVLALCWGVIPALRTIKQSPKQASLLLFPAVVGLSSVAYFTVIQFFPLDFWFVSYFASFQPERLPLHLLYFVLGIWAWKHGWFTQRGYSPRKRAWLPVFVISSFVYLFVKLNFAAAQAPLWSKQAVLALSLTTYCFASLMGGITVFRAFLNRGGAILRSAADSSYGVYYLHALIVYLLVYEMIGFELSIYSKALIVFVLASAISWILSAYVLRKVPLLRRMF